jgi:hypothetical protein
MKPYKYRPTTNKDNTTANSILFLEEYKSDVVQTTSDGKNDVLDDDALRERPFLLFVNLLSSSSRMVPIFVVVLDDDDVSIENTNTQNKIKSRLLKNQ